MTTRPSSRLSKKTHYLQVALNSTLDDAARIISELPSSDRIIIEAGTPLIKRYGMEAIRTLHYLASQKQLMNTPFVHRESDERRVLDEFGLLGMVLQAGIKHARSQKSRLPLGDTAPSPYIVADMKTIDRGETEVAMASNAGASAVIAMGHAPIETLNAFIASCEVHGVDAMIDMMNVEFPLTTLRALKKQPRVVILHRGVDEERDNRQKMLPLHEIRRIKGAYDTLVAVAGGDTPREIQSAAFNDADIVVIWKASYSRGPQLKETIDHFLKTVK